MQHARARFLITVLSLLTAVLALAQAPAPAAEEVLGDVRAAAQAWEMIDNGALLIDVRSAEEYAGGHIEDSVNIPHSEIVQIASLIGAERDRAVVLYCRSGRRAGQAQSALEAMGYTGVFNGSGYEALVVTKP